MFDPNLTLIQNLTLKLTSYLIQTLTQSQIIQILFLKLLNKKMKNARMNNF